MFKYLIFIFLIQALISNASINSIKDLVNSVKNFTTDKHIELKNELNQLQSSDCMPDSYAYNETCIYFSSGLERLSWFQAEKICNNLPLKMSLLVIQNEHHFKFIHQKLIQLKENETSIDDLIFLVGFKNEKNTWKWIDNRTVNLNRLSKLRLGKCGSIVLNSNRQLSLRSSPCHSINSRFLCQYTINSCFENKCINNGKCINLYATFHCECSFLWKGKFCEKLNPKTLQTVIACSISMVFLAISIAKKFKFFISHLAIRKTFKFSQSSYSIRSKLKVLTFTKSIGLLSILLKLFSVLILIQIQVFFIHSFTIFGRFASFNFKTTRRYNHIINLFCNSYETYYLFIELIYLSISLVYFALFLILKLANQLHIKPYRVKNRHISSAIYIAYTHDIIKMLAFIFFSDLNDKALPIIGHQEGIFADLIIKLINTILIGTKFFPLLLGLDSKSISMRFACCLYSLIVWTLELSILTFCKNDSNKYLNTIENIFNQSSFKVNLTSMRTFEGENFKYSEFFILIENIPVYGCLSLLLVYYFFSLLKAIIKWRFSSNDSDQNSSSNLVNIKNENMIQNTKLSRHFVSLYSVAFMIVYFLTLIGIRLVSTFSSNLIDYFNITVKYIFKQPKPFVTRDLFQEFLFTFLLTSFLISIQLSLNIMNFRNDLKLLKTGKTLFRGLSLRNYLEKKPAKHTQIILSSLHFPGYLVAHVIYSYFIFATITFFAIIFVKLIGYVPSFFFESFIRFILPLFLVLFFRLILIKYIEKLLFSTNYNSNLYHIYTYFVFFSDCLIGLISCLGRIWKTACYTCIMLPRLDKSLFSQDEIFLLHILDRGHLSYLNYLRREYLFGSANQINIEPIPSKSSDIKIDSKI